MGWSAFALLLPCLPRPGGAHRPRPVPLRTASVPESARERPPFAFPPDSVHADCPEVLLSDDDTNEAQTSENKAAGRFAVVTVAPGLQVWLACILFKCRLQEDGQG